jgi:anti-anti-sigma factor
VSVIQEISHDGMTVQININGRFDFRLSQQFRNAYRKIPDHEGVTFHVDLRNTHYIDSSALGMMLLLREYAKCRGGSVIIDSPSEQIDKLLKVANFEQLFVIN